MAEAWIRRDVAAAEGVRAEARCRGCPIPRRVADCVVAQRYTPGSCAGDADSAYAFLDQLVARSSLCQVLRDRLAVAGERACWSTSVSPLDWLLVIWKVGEPYSRMLRLP
jgi:hypothetical protein